MNLFGLVIVCASLVFCGQRHIKPTLPLVGLKKIDDPKKNSCTKSSKIIILYLLGLHHVIQGVALIKVTKFGKLWKIQVIYTWARYKMLRFLSVRVLQVNYKLQLNTEEKYIYQMLVYLAFRYDVQAFKNYIIIRFKLPNWAR